MNFFTNTAYKLLFLCILFLIITASCATTLPPAERTTEEIKQADRIILITENQENLYKLAGQHLTDLGFVIENSDSELGSLQTDLKAFTEGMFTYTVRVSVSIRDDEVHFYGNTGSPLLGESQIDNRGMNNSQAKNAWNKLKEIAISFPHSEVYYKRG